MASASQDEVLKSWEGLGYYSRARNLHAAAQDVMNRYNGVFPDTYEGIISLKGIGPYAAAAIGSFVYGIPKVVVDGNVLRVISRLYGIQKPVDIPATKRQITELAQALLDHQDPAEFNQTIMEFGALHCTYKNPACPTCPLSKFCVAYEKDVVSILPVKSKKIKKKTRHFRFYILEDSRQNILIEQRAAKDIWQGLYQFPALELEKKSDAASLHDISDIGPIKAQLEGTSEEYKQTLTHQYIRAVFYHYKLKQTLSKGKHKNRVVIPMVKIKELPWPKIIANYLADRGLV